MQVKFSEKYEGTEIPVTDIEKKLAEWVPQGSTPFSLVISGVIRIFTPSCPALRPKVTH